MEEHIYYYMKMTACHRHAKRGVLRTMLRINDPLGLATFFIVHIKILMQDIWRSSIGWDEEMNESQFENWNLGSISYRKSKI